MISKSNHVKFARFVLLGVSEECMIKQLLDSVFVIFRIIEVSVRVISLSLRLRLITPTSTSIILDITKTSFNNCLLQGTKATRALKATVNDRRLTSLSKCQQLSPPSSTEKKVNQLLVQLQPHLQFLHSIPQASKDLC